MKITEFTCWIAFALLILSGLDSGLYGLFHFHLIDAIFGSGFIGRLLGILIGLSGGYLVWRLFPKKIQKSDVINLPWS